MHKESVHKYDPVLNTNDPRVNSVKPTYASWRDEPLTKGEAYDALMGAVALVKKGVTRVAAGVESNRRYRVEHEIIKLIGSVVQTLGEETANKIKGDN